MFHPKSFLTLPKNPENKKVGDKDISTEEKIMQAARVVFTRKGYAATRTRDIAEEAGINLALLNYYFRSKEKLFSQIMQEKAQLMFGLIFPIVTDESTILEHKIDKIAEGYIELLLKNQDLPIFVLSEIRSNPERFAQMMNVGEVMANSSLVRQLHERKPEIHPFQLITAILGMLIFPFVAKPILFPGKDDQAEMMFSMLMQQRKVLIPQWIKAVLGT